MKRKNKHLHRQSHADENRTMGALNIPMNVWKRGRKAAWNYWLAHAPEGEQPNEADWLSPHARKQQIVHQVKAWGHKVRKDVKFELKAKRKTAIKNAKAAAKAKLLKIVPTTNMPFSEWGCSVKRQERRDRINYRLALNVERKTNGRRAA